MALLAKYCTGPLDTYACTEAVGVSVGMTHDKYLVLGADDFLEGMSLNSGSDSRIALLLLALASIEVKLVFIFNYCLISTSSESQVNGITGKFRVLGICESVYTDTD